MGHLKNGSLVVPRHGKQFTREMIPPHVGIGSHRWTVQMRTLLCWAAQATTGLYLFSQHNIPIDTRYKAAALGLLFPGAGYIASGNILGCILLILTLALYPLVFLAWFGSGAIAIPLLLWIASIPGAYFATGRSVWEPAGKCAAAVLFGIFFFANRVSAAQRAKGVAHRETRNALLERSLEEIDAIYVEAPPPGSRELGLSILRRIQHIIDAAQQDKNDWTWFTKIDQFQTSALRYQIYEMLYVLGTYQGIYTPNAHTYISDASCRLVEKAITQDVLGFWKWEKLLGHFSTDCDPVKKDNIMVTGFFLEGLMLYTANTQDERFCQPGSLPFQVTKDRVFHYDIHSIREAMMDQWKSNPFCLFPCEPNWTYIPCNFQGFIGSLLYDRYFGGNETALISPTFEESLNRNFTESSGSILPIRSELTGFTLPGLCGALTDLSNVMFTRATFPHISRRFWALFPKENIEFNRATGELKCVGLRGADKIDSGTYRPDPYAMYGFVAQAASEYGDQELSEAAINIAYKAYGTVTTPTGAIALPREDNGPSTTTKMTILRAELLHGGELEAVVTKVPYPGVLVAKAYSHDSSDLDVVLYPSADSGRFSITVSRLRPGLKYKGLEETVVADDNGDAVLSVMVDGRTSFHLKLVHA
ncbi:uncharacterized protein FTJAE_10087 [Fusarium tjaetaba]|uniref:Linalool dehydratase/isomerase domain-containing protein n=1 Tax=Fusarium tjaetaba TaxID=1567544 RepID=A0A8H5VK46_9HYPO|nr:uncharacterized protein FTJAE_10087 [Fusarium tjaetaba]KAF5625190.1 hypothetical protein FTJAE_10087 [Fusarium tjaetaba]